MNWSKAGLIIGSIFVFMFWLYVPKDELEDPDEKFIVTFSYDCRTVIDDEDVPDHVIEECKKLFEEIKNESQSTKQSI